MDRIREEVANQIGSSSQSGVNPFRSDNNFQITCSSPCYFNLIAGYFCLKTRYVTKITDP